MEFIMEFLNGSKLDMLKKIHVKNVIIKVHIKNNLMYFMQMEI